MSRSVEVVVSGLALLTLLPLLALIACCILSRDGRPVLYTSRRVGRNGELFILYKFRTMHRNAERGGAGLTIKDDSRITSFGKFLREFKLDELPQLFNVLKGDMSLVGPRPEDPQFVQGYSDEQRKVLKVRPGITGPASLVYRDESSLLSGEDWEKTYVRQILPHKLALEIDYLSRRSPWSDLSLIFRTIGKVLR